MAKLKDSTLMVLNYLKAHQGERVIAQDIANATGLSLKSVNGSITSFTNPNKQWAKKNEDKTIEITAAGLSVE